MRSQGSDDARLTGIAVTLPATAEYLASVYSALSQFWTELERCHPTPPDRAWRARFDTAVGEVAANIIRYAYESTSTGDMSISIDGFRDRVEATFRDRGVPYTGTPPAHARMPSDSIDAREIPEAGWGLALTSAAVDRLSYTREADINCWRFMKKL